jgi:hypothetical protein
MRHRRLAVAAAVQAALALAQSTDPIRQPHCRTSISTGTRWRSRPERRVAPCIRSRGERKSSGRFGVTRGDGRLIVVVGERQWLVDAAHVGSHVLSLLIRPSVRGRSADSRVARRLVRHR